MLDVSLDELLPEICRLRRLFAGLQSAIDALAGELPGGLIARLDDLFALWKTGLDFAASCATDGLMQGEQDTGGVPPISNDLWDRLRAVTESAFTQDGLKDVWFRFGAALGRFEVELLHNYSTQHIQPVLDGARQVCEQSSNIPEIQKLAEFSGRTEPDQVSSAGQSRLLVEVMQSVEDRTGGPPVSNRSSLKALVRALDEQLRPHLQDFQSRPSQQGTISGSDIEWRTGPHFGLKFCDETRRVKRKDSEPIPLSKLNWGLLNHFAEKGDVASPKEDVRLVWERWGRARAPTDGTVTDAVNELGNKLQDLGLDVKADGDRGWKLIDRSTSPEPTA